MFIVLFLYILNMQSLYYVQNYRVYFNLFSSSPASLGFSWRLCIRREKFSNYLCYSHSGISVRYLYVFDTVCSILFKFVYIFGRSFEIRNTACQVKCKMKSSNFKVTFCGFWSESCYQFVHIYEHEFPFNWADRTWMEAGTISEEGNRR